VPYLTPPLTTEERALLVSGVAGPEATRAPGFDPNTGSAKLHATKPGHPLDTQVGGGHYKDMAIQPVEYIHKNGIRFIEGSVIKYVSRWRDKGGVEDLKKARHLLDLLIDFEGA
jgi:hypothetical protein